MQVRSFTLAGMAAQLPDQRAAMLRWTNRCMRMCTDNMLTRRAAPQLHYRSTIQPLAGRVSYAIATILNSAVPYDVRYKNIAAAYPRLEQLSLADLWVCAANTSLIFILFRFLFTIATSTFVRNHLHHFRQLSPRIVLTPSHRKLRDIIHHLPTDLTTTSYFIVEILALPVFVVHQLGYTNLPPRKDGESIYFRYTAIAALTPLWVLAFAATMVLFVFGSVLDFVSRSVKKIFGQKTTTDWHQIDVEHGTDIEHAVWRPRTAAWKSDNAVATFHTGSSDDDLTPLPGAWGSAKVWEDIKRDKGALLREKDNLDAERAAWRLEVTRQKEEKRAFDLERQRLRGERLEFQKQQQRLNADIKASAEARKDVEAILRSFIEKSQSSSQVISKLQTRVKSLPVTNSMMLGNPTPPASPKSSRTEYADCSPTPSKRRARVQAAIPA